MIKIEELAVGQFVKLKKAHPCGGYVWQIMALGMDCRLKCQTCGHLVILSRRDLAKRVTAILD